MLKFKKLSNLGVIPTKAGPNEIGYVLTIIKKVKKINDVTTMYDTDICVEPSNGLYTEIIPRSSFIKTGYILTNSVGIIDPTYRGTLKIVVTKISNDALPLDLPCKYFQLIPRQIINTQSEIVNNLSNSTREDGGFGSTNNN